MITKMSWKFLPLAALVAVMALVLLPGGGYSPHKASADATAITVDDATLLSGESTGLDATFNAAANPTNTITFSLLGVASTTTVTIHISSCTPSCTGGIVDNNTASPTITTDNVTAVAGSLDVACTADDTFNVRVDQNGSNDRKSVAVTCQAAANNLTISKTATGAAADLAFSFTIAGTGTACDKSFTLTNAASTGYLCDDSGTYTITESTVAGWSLSAINCTVGGETTFSVTLADRKVDVTFTSDTDNDDTISCTFVNISATPTVGTAATVTASASPNSVGCNASSFITLAVKDSTGAAVVNGTSVNVAVSGGGSVNPTTATTSSGGALVLYTAPASGSGTATITATAGSAVGSTTVGFACAAAQATVAPPPPAAAPTSQIAPPNTGDAGLADHSSFPMAAAVALIVSTLIGALVAKRVVA